LKAFVFLTWLRSAKVSSRLSTVVVAHLSNTPGAIVTRPETAAIEIIR
jgi:hypothetical protein